MTAPPRRTQRRTHLSTEALAVECALLHRAGVLDERSDSAPEHPELGIGPAESRLLREVAGEFRALGEELHWW